MEGSSPIFPPVDPQTQRELVAFVNGWNGAEMTFDCINRDCAPRPKVELRTMPPGGRDPLRERPPQTAASVIAT